MPTNLSGRVTAIAAVLLFALWAIFPTAPKAIIKLFNPQTELSIRPDLRPGIDMVGGTSLIYEIKVPEGGHPGNVAEDVMTALKKRVDPDGVRGLVWIPQGNTRLEIQMPMTARAKESRAIRETFAKVQQDLEDTNVRVGEVRFAVQDLKPEERAAALQRLEHGSPARKRIFDEMVRTWDRMQAARQAQNAGEQAQLQLEYERLLDQLAETNFTVADLERVLDLPDQQAREKDFAKLKERFADFPQRLTAIEAFAAEYAQYSRVKGAIDDASELKRLLRGSGVIEFHILANDLAPQEYQAMAERLERRGPRTQAGDSTRWYEVDRGPQVIAQVEQHVQALMRAEGDDRQQADIIRRAVAELGDSREQREHLTSMFDAMARALNDPPRRREIQKEIEDNLLQLGRLEDYAGRKWALLYITNDRNLVQREGQAKWKLEQAYPLRDQGELQVGFRFDPQGAMMFGELTGENIGKALAIVLDDKLISAPRINSRIGASGVITGGGQGGFSPSEMTYLVNTLNAGALSAQLTEEPISERTIGPQLGEDNLRRGLNACYFGLVVVAVFLIGYYYLSGVVATTAVMMNMVLILGGMAALDAAFTLPGIAGIVLTIGMAVDANVLIFERLREEQLRGLSLRMALRNAYDRAWYAIFDANVTTAITAFALWVFGSEEVKGFGITLLLGIISSMFTSLYVTKTIFAFLVDKLGVQSLSSLPLTFPKWDKFLRPNFDWMGKAWIFCTFGAVFIVIGLVLFGIRFAQGKMLDIEFASGTSVEFDLKQPMPIDQMRDIITKASVANPTLLPSPSVVSVGTDGKSYKVDTTNQVAKDVREVILEALKDQINVTVPSKYDMVGQTLTEARGQAVYPIEPTTTTIAGRAPDELKKHMGGVAVVLRNLDPPLQAEEIEKRIQQQRLQPQVGSGSAKRYSRIDVDVSPDGKTAIVMASDPDLPYDGNDAVKQQQWTDELAAPIWNLVHDAINKPADLQKVTNFDAAIAGEAQRQAFVALVLSLIAIMAYIWLRFGNLKFGTATVIALLHDSLFVLAAVGVAHYLANTSIGQAMLLEPFRINLNLVAAILTVMGYSMNDTVVVFDRIRENRGKFGHVDRQVINDSINQTLSRTLLTGGTTILTIFVMYVFGGPGIHGFTFALLIGILVGTYSSIAIASPILLFGQTAAEKAASRRGDAMGQRQLQGA